MADIDPADIPLPQILDPILSYLSSVVPPPLYSLILTFLSHSLALITAFWSLSQTLFSSRPWEWDAQTVIPPLITVLAAYLALLSLYRTTSWMFRTGLFFVKWGTIIGALVAGAGWIAGNGNGGEGVGREGGMGGGIFSFLTGLALNAINGQGQNAAGGARNRPRTRSQSRTAPRAWDSFQQHRDWQYQDNNNANNNDGNGVFQDIVGGIVGAAERGGWLDAAKNAFEAFQNAGAAGEEEEAGTGTGTGTGRRKQPARKAKTKANSRAPR